MGPSLKNNPINKMMLLLGTDLFADARSVLLYSYTIFLSSLGYMFLEAETVPYMFCHSSCRCHHHPPPCAAAVPTFSYGRLHIWLRRLLMGLMPDQLCAAHQQLAEPRVQWAVGKQRGCGRGDGTGR